MKETDTVKRTSLPAFQGGRYILMLWVITPLAIALDFSGCFCRRMASQYAGHLHSNEAIALLH